jgi:hypothetical protein
MNQRHRESIMMQKAAIEARETYEVSLERLMKNQSEIQSIALKLKQLEEQDMSKVTRWNLSRWYDPVAEVRLETSHRDTQKHRSCDGILANRSR